jgi:precorrin-2/cobalt-factor-2 C20-methyltransferase
VKRVNKQGKIYVIGVGPGDPELMTIKAVNILKRVPILCFPKGKEEGGSVAMTIVSDLVSLAGKEIIEIYFPMKKLSRGNAPYDLEMKWEETVNIILDRNLKGMDIAFPTIGDPTLYSTFFYLYNTLFRIEPSIALNLIPGVSAMSASAASAQISLCLGSERIAILPATYEEEGLRDILISFDTIVLMKVNKVLDSLLLLLDELELTDHTIVVERASMKDERVIKDIRSLHGQILHYFSTMIVRKNRTIPKSTLGTTP